MDLTAGLDEPLEDPPAPLAKANRRCDKVVRRNIIPETSPEAKRRRLQTARTAAAEIDWDLTRKRSDTSMICGAESQRVCHSQQTITESSHVAVAEELLDIFEDIWLKKCSIPLRGRTTRQLISLLETALSIDSDQMDGRALAAFHAFGWELVLLVILDDQVAFDRASAVCEFICALTKGIPRSVMYLLPATSLFPPITFNSFHPILTRYVKDGVTLNLGPLAWLLHIILIRPHTDHDYAGSIPCPLCRSAEQEDSESELAVKLASTMLMEIASAFSIDTPSDVWVVYILYLVIPFVLCPKVAREMFKKLDVKNLGFQEIIIRALAHIIDLIKCTAKHGDEGRALADLLRPTNICLSGTHFIIGNLSVESYFAIFECYCLSSCLLILDSDFGALYPVLEKLNRQHKSRFAHLRDVSKQEEIILAYSNLMSVCFNLVMAVSPTRWDFTLVHSGLRKHHTDVDTLLCGPDSYIFCLHPSHVKTKSSDLFPTPKIRIPAPVALTLYQDSPDLQTAFPTENCYRSKTLIQAMLDKFLDLSGIVKLDGVSSELRNLMARILRQTSSSLECVTTMTAVSSKADALLIELFTG